jgi:hypothetical protein BACCOPRO_01349
LFEISTTLSFNIDKLVDGEQYDYVTRTSSNQGVLRKTGYVNQDNINEKGTWSLGLLQMDFFYRKNQWYAGQFVRKIIPKITLEGKSILFFTTILNMQKQKLLNVLVRDVDSTFSNAYVQLPTKDGKIDFKFIDDYISELEEERISELSAYLTVSGLDNYELSNDENEALENLNLIQWEEYNIEKLFGKSTRGKRLKSDDRIKGSLPFVTAGEANTGISDFIGNGVEVFSKNTITIDMFGSAKYRNYNYGGDDHIAVVHTEKIKPESAIFVTSAVHKSSYNGQFNYGRNFYAKDADTLNIMLPTKNNEIDFSYMELLISAVKKLVIKDVVIYADNKIEATKKVIHRN